MNLRLLSLVLLWTVYASAVAGPITFIHVGSASGTLDGDSFADRPFAITAIGDTSNRESSAALHSIDHNTASIEIQGLGSFEFLTGTRTFNNAGLVGFSRATTNGSDLYNGPDDVVFESWEMLTSIGPIRGSIELLQWRNSDIQTDGGVLVFTDGSTEGSFEAIVPEPNAWWIAVSGFGIGALGRQRRKRCSANPGQQSIPVGT